LSAARAEFCSTGSATNHQSEVAARGRELVGRNERIDRPGLGWTITRLSRERAEDLQTALDFAFQDIPKRATAA
jgi:hypothetical protein